MAFKTVLKKIFFLFDRAAKSGVLLFGATILAVLITNSNLQHHYNNIFAMPFSLNLGIYSFSLSIQAWINDFLMAIFFLLVGMEIKREMIGGYLASTSQRLLPIIAAISGVVVPIIIYSTFNYHDVTKKGWAIPAATDIAFTLSALTTFGKHIPKSLQVFVTALAIIDDLIAIIVVAAFYTDTIFVEYLVYAFTVVLVLFCFNRLGVPYLTLYFLLGIILWYCLLRSGIHPTIAGVILGFLIPLRVNSNIKISLILYAEKAIQPFVAYIILPLFAFANSGLAFFSMTGANFFDPVIIGTTLGLFLGKQFGIFTVVMSLIKGKIIKMPKDARVIDVYVVSVLCGIGFTMSLFIATLSFERDALYLSQAKIGIFAGSILSLALGIILLVMFQKKKCTSGKSQTTP
ncbi:Na(+)/H(+) antiporter NhaA 2 [Alphaproteobacteria bacterium]